MGGGKSGIRKRERRIVVREGTAGEGGIRKRERKVGDMLMGAVLKVKGHLLCH